MMTGVGKPPGCYHHHYSLIEWHEYDIVDTDIYGWTYVSGQRERTMQVSISVSGRCLVSAALVFQALAWSCVCLFAGTTSTSAEERLLHIGDHFDDQDDWTGHDGVGCVDPPLPWSSYGDFCSDRIRIDDTDDVHGDGKCMWVAWAPAMQELGLMTFAVEGPSEFWVGFWWRHNPGWEWGRIDDTPSAASSTLDGDTDAFAEEIDLLDATDFPADDSFYVLIEEELLWCSGKDGNRLTGCIRGYFGTDAAPHASGTAVDKYIRDTTHKWFYGPESGGDRMMINFDQRHRAFWQGNTQLTSDIPFDRYDDSWHRVVIMLKHNTPHNCDGELRLWWNGVEAEWTMREGGYASNTELQFDDTECIWESFVVFGYQSRPDWGYGNTSYFDDIILADNRDDVEAFLEGSPSAVPQGSTNRGSALLAQCRPNPSSNGTTIHYSLTGPQHVRIQIHDQIGRLIRTLTDEQRQAGSHAVHWDGRDARGHRLCGGTYYYRLEADGRVVPGKALSIR